MNDRVKQFRVGVVVLFTSIIGAILVTLNGPSPDSWVPGLTGGYTVTVELPQAPGIGPGTPVRKNGLLIGRVSQVDDLQDHVAVQARIDGGRLLYGDFPVQVRTTVLGDATLEFIATPIRPGEQPVRGGAVFRGTVVPSPLEAIGDMEGDLKLMIDSLTKAGDEVSVLAKTVNAAIGAEPEAGRVPKLLDTAEQSMANLSQAATTFERFFGDPELKSTIREARVTMRDVRDVARGVQEPIASIDRNLKNLEGLTEPLGRNGEQVASSMIAALDGLSKIVEELTVLTEALNNREGTIGKLVHNPDVYDNLNRLLCNSNQVVLRIYDLTNRLRPIVDDVRVFTDKIAREPGRFVGGALSSSPGIK